jgi:DNA polymerase-4
VTLKLKRADFTPVTRSLTLPAPTQLADRLWRAASGLFAGLPAGVAYRLAGIGLSHLVPETEAGAEADLLDPGAGRRAAAERAVDAVRARFGAEAIVKGRALR